MAKIRYNVIVMTSSKGVRKANWTATISPLRPGTIDDGFDGVVQSQYEHMGFGKRFNGLTKIVVKGIRFKGAGIDDTDVVWMWCPATRVATVVKVVRA
jgi:hypothetical protein